MNDDLLGSSLSVNLKHKQTFKRQLQLRHDSLKETRQETNSFSYIPTVTKHFPFHDSSQIIYSSKKYDQQRPIRDEWEWEKCDNQLLHSTFFLSSCKQTKFPSVLMHTLCSGDVSGDWARDSGSRHIPDGSEGQDRKWLQTGKEEVGSKEAGRFPAANLGPETSSLPVRLWDRHTFVFTCVALTADEGKSSQPLDKRRHILAAVDQFVRSTGSLISIIITICATG